MNVALYDGAVLTKGGTSWRADGDTGREWVRDKERDIAKVERKEELNRGQGQERYKSENLRQKQGRQKQKGIGSLRGTYEGRLGGSQG